jgi:hypothetical protein
VSEVATHVSIDPSAEAGGLQVFRHDGAVELRRPTEGRSTQRGAYGAFGATVGVSAALFGLVTFNGVVFAMGFLMFLVFVFRSRMGRASVEGGEGLRIADGALWRLDKEGSSHLARLDEVDELRLGGTAEGDYTVYARTPAGRVLLVDGLTSEERELAAATVRAALAA